MMPRGVEHGVMASLDGDAIWVRFPMMPRGVERFSRKRPAMSQVM